MVTHVKTLRTQDTLDPRHCLDISALVSTCFTDTSTPAKTLWQCDTRQHWTKPRQGGQLCLH